MAGPPPIANPDDSLFDDRDRYVGDPTDMPRVDVGRPAALGVAVLIATAGLVGLILVLTVTWLVVR